jgi:hypothetical protein
MSGGVLGTSVSSGVTGVVDLPRSLSPLLTFFCVYRDTDEHVHKDDFSSCLRVCLHPSESRATGRAICVV